MMERPFKRPRLSFVEDSRSFPDDFDVQEARAQNDLRLKSVFESIFEKYGKDFSDVGDEIDLQTGEIIVNNGHLSGLQGEDDIGQNGGPSQEGEPLSPVSSSLDFLPNDQEHLPKDAPSGSGRDNAENYEAEVLSTADIHQEKGSLMLPSISQNLSDGAFPRVNDLESDNDAGGIDSLIQHVTNPRNNTLEKGTKPCRKESGALTEVTNLPESKSAPLSDDIWQRKQAVDSVWQVPEIEAKFSTPIVTKMASRPSMLLNRARSASPPGAGSIWALPTPGRKRNTDIVKKSKKVISLDKPKRKRNSTSKKKDWSFAVVTDTSDSDDPLQEDYQPSPTMRAKSNQPTSIAQTIEVEASPVGEVFFAPGSPQELDGSLPGDSPRGLYGIDTHREESQGLEASSLSDAKPGESEQFKSEDQQPGEPDIPKSIDIDLSQNSIQTIVKTKAQSPMPDINNSSRYPITPDEAKIIMRLRHIDRSSWKDISATLPGRTAFQITQWNHMHWQNRQLNPPKLSKPWSDEDRRKLAKFKNMNGVSWGGIQAEFPGRTRAEIEFKLLGLWIGVTEADSGGPHHDSEDDDFDTDLNTTGVSVLPSCESVEEKPSLTHTQNDPSTPQRRKLNRANPPRQANTDFEDLIETGSLAGDSDGLQTSGLSSIQLEARENGSSTGRLKRSPSKSLVSPLAKLSGLAGSRRSFYF